MAHQYEAYSRRNFLKTGSLALAGIAAGLPVIGATRRDKVIKIGIIGVGNRGRGIANVMQALPGLELIACCDILESQLDVSESVPATVKRYADFRRLLDNADVEGVVIALPEHLHFPAAVAALQAGKHVYLEKTMTHTIDEADRLVQVAAGYPRQVLQIGHQYRYFMLYHKVNEAIRQGWIGDVLQYECQYHRNSDWRRPVPDTASERQVNWRMYKAYSGGLMTELCAHQVDVLNWFTGSHPLDVTAVGGIDYWKDGRETYDNIRAIYSYPGGVRANVSAILTNGYKGYSIRVLGTEGTIEIQRTKALMYPENTKKALATVDGVTGATSESWGQGKPVPLAFENQDDLDRDPTAYALLDFADCVRTGKRPFSNVETGRNSAKAVMLANRSAETGNLQLWR